MFTTNDLYRRTLMMRLHKIKVAFTQKCLLLRRQYTSIQYETLIIQNVSVYTKTYSCMYQKNETSKCCLTCLCVLIF